METIFLCKANAKKISNQHLREKYKDRKAFRIMNDKLVDKLREEYINKPFILHWE